MSKYSIGIDVGSSSVKVALLDIATGQQLASSTNPSQEMPIKSLESGWAEQDPDMWWKYLSQGIKELAQDNDLSKVASIGISYQMHGVVLVDKEGKPLRDSLIWCDSRGVKYGEAATEAIGEGYCQNNLLNKVGNFTASKLAWVKENEPELFSKIHKLMLPGDYIAYKLSGEMTTTSTALSEGIFWDFKKECISDEVTSFFGFNNEMFCDVRDAIGVHSYTNSNTATLFGIKEATPISYKAGDQPNNAFSLNVMEPGEIAATGGTSGVVYGVYSDPQGDAKSRVNSFIHVNHTKDQKRYGALLCINGTGIANAWARRNIVPNLDYVQMNELAQGVQPGSDGVLVLPFGNGAERMLENKYPKSSIIGLDFTRHNNAHILRATQEGIAFAFAYGIEIMKEMGMKINTLRAGKANLFLSDIFVETLSSLCEVEIELYNTDGALGAARGAAWGAGYYKNREEVFASLKVLSKITPNSDTKQALQQAYNNWKHELTNKL